MDYNGPLFFWSLSNQSAITRGIKWALGAFDSLFWAGFLLWSAVASDFDFGFIELKEIKMKRFESVKWSAALGAGILATVALMPQANAELVYEDGVEGRAALREALDSSEKAQAAVTAPAAAAPAATVPQATTPVVIVQPAQPVVAAPVPQIEVGPPAETTEIQHLSKSELMRRERLRQEMKNEDMLQERLEELRLQDERRRTDSLFGQENAPAASVAPAAALQEQIVTAPVTENPGAGVVKVPVQEAPAATVETGPIGQSSVADISNESDKSQFYLLPRAGFTELSNKSGLDIRPRFSGGIALGVVSSENVSFEFGYTYSEFGVAMASVAPYAYQTQEPVAMKQNLIDAGMKLHFLSTHARLRPFISGGGAYSLSFINYDQAILNRINQDPSLKFMAGDYKLSSYLGYLGTGLDVKVNRSISIGATFKYYTVLNSRERSSMLNNTAYGVPYGYMYPTSADWEKQAVGSSVAKNSFYSILFGTTFTF